MTNFFEVTDKPEDRVVEYRRINSPKDATGHVVFIDDESVLGSPAETIPFADKTGLSAENLYVYRVPYLPDVGPVYFSVQPEDAEVVPGASHTLAVEAKGGKAPYAFAWYFEGANVISSAPLKNGSLVLGEMSEDRAGYYFCVVTDADGVNKVSKQAFVTITKP